MSSADLIEEHVEASPQPEKLSEPEEGYQDIMLVTGGLGFIGSHFVKHYLDYLGRRSRRALILNVDSNTYAAAKGTRFAKVISHEALHDPYYSFNKQLPSFKIEYDKQHGATDANGRGQGNTDHRLLQFDIISGEMLDRVVDKYQPNLFVHFAACSHVDRSIGHERHEFVDTNVKGTMCVLDAALRSRDLVTANGRNHFNFLYVSTDEVYGPYDGSDLGEGYMEDKTLDPRNPYSATKAAGEYLVRSYGNTYDLPFNITRGCNTYGPYQFPEKFIPVVIDNLLRDREVPIYGDGQQTREWIHVQDHVRAILKVLLFAQPGETFNIGSGYSLSNLALAREVCGIIGKPESLLKQVTDRPGHDRDYRINSDKLKSSFAWHPDKTAEKGSFAETVGWYASTLGRSWVEFTNHNTADRLGLHP